MDIAFYLTASLGIIIFGISKGGFAGPVSILAVPIMSLSMNPILAAGILLPILLIMDFIAIYFYWKIQESTFDIICSLEFESLKGFELIQLNELNTEFEKKESDFFDF